MDKKGKIKSYSRIDQYAITGIIVAILWFCFHIVLAGVIGDNGIAYFCVASEIYLIINLFLTYGISVAVSSLVKYRMRREQYRSAAKVLRRAIELAVITGVAGGIVLFVLQEFIAQIATLEALSQMAVSVLAPCILCSAVIGVFRGYFEGIGTKVPTMHSRLIEIVLMFAGGMIGAGIAYNYGLKVAALLKSDAYAAAYGAMGAGIGMILASILTMLHMIFLYFLYRGNIKKQITRDMTKSSDAQGHVFRMLVFSILPYGCYTLAYTLNTMIDLRMFVYHMNKTGQDANAAVQFGMYYGKYMAIIGIVAAVCCLIPANNLRKIVGLWERDDPRNAKDKLSSIIHNLAVVTIPAAILLAVLAQNITDVFWGKSNTLVAQMIQYGSVLVLLISFSYLFMGLLLRLRRIALLLIFGAAAFIIHIPVVSLLLESMNMGIEGVILGMIVFFAILCIASFIALVRILQYRQEWIRTFAITCVAGGIAGLITMLLDRALFSATGALISGLICFIVGILVYTILLIVLRGVNESELNKMPGGRILIRFCKMVHLM